MIWRKGAIYYRYNSQNSEIDYPELHNIIELEKNKINALWMQTIRQIGDSGITKTVLLDLKNGKMTGANTSLYIDESLLNDISFVQKLIFLFTNSEYYAIIILKSINNKTDGKPVIPLLTYTFGTYIQDNYIITLLLLSALIIMLIGNRKMKISGTL